MTITLRPVSSSDDRFLFSLYASTRTAELAQVPWTELQKQAFLQMQYAAQKSSYAAQYPDAEHVVISRDAEPVGRLYLARCPDRVHILDITVAERCRKNGVGSFVLNEIVREASEAGKPTTIYIEPSNPSVGLFERLGFRQVSVRDFQILLERRPSVASLSQEAEPTGSEGG